MKRDQQLTQPLRKQKIERFVLIYEENFLNIKIAIREVA